MTNKRPDPFILWLHLKFNFLYYIFFLSKTMMVVNKIHHNKAGKKTKTNNDYIVQLNVVRFTDGSVDERPSILL